MPRIYTSTNDPLDFCQKHFPKSERSANQRFGDLGEGPDNRGNCFDYDAAHPSYECGDYHCYDCGVELTELDDYTPS